MSLLPSPQLAVPMSFAPSSEREDGLDHVLLQATPVFLWGIAWGRPHTIFLRANLPACLYCAPAEVAVSSTGP